MDKTRKRPRKFKVPRGTGARLARELGLAESHISRVIRGQREGGPTLCEALANAESIHKEKK